MSVKTLFRAAAVTLILIALLLSSCSGLAAVTPTSAPPDWLDIEMVDVRTGETFTINDFAGKVVLVETMAEWCTTCLAQQKEVTEMHSLLGDSDEEVISISLDIDVNEDEASLKEYVEQHGFNWRFAVAPIEVARALGNLYSAEYLNPPFAPMLLIDRNGDVYGLPFGIKSAASLHKTIESYLAK